MAHQHRARGCDAKAPHLHDRVTQSGRLRRSDERGRGGRRQRRSDPFAAPDATAGDVLCEMRIRREDAKLASLTLICSPRSACEWRAAALPRRRQDGGGLSCHASWLKLRLARQRSQPAGLACMLAPRPRVVAPLLRRCMLRLLLHRRCCSGASPSVLLSLPLLGLQSCSTIAPPVHAAQRSGAGRGLRLMRLLHLHTCCILCVSAE